MANRIDRSRASLAVLAWALGFFATFQLALVLAKEFWRPELADPEYGNKLACLRRRLAERPGARPLVIALGSSRTSLGLRTEALRANRAAGDGPLIYNFGLCQFGPTGELMCLSRLLADGVRPDAVLIEIFPTMLMHETTHVDRFDLHRLRWADHQLFTRYVSDPARLKRRWRRAQLVPWHTQRYLLLNQWAPDWLARENRLDLQWRGLQALGWVEYPLFDEAHPEWEAKVLSQCRTALQTFHACEVSDRALRELLTLCRVRGITAAALLPPESSRYRACYSPACFSELNAYLAGLQREFGFRLIDARDWLDDADFVESIHLTHAGAQAFTRVFEQCALVPILASSGPYSNDWRTSTPPKRH